MRFERADVDLFGALSHDVNPLHVSEAYASRTAFGDRVVHGVLVALRSLAEVLSAPPGEVELASLTVDFLAPAFPGVTYQVSVTARSPSQLKLRVNDGRRSLLRLTASLRPRHLEPSAAPTFGDPDASSTPRTIASTPSTAALEAGASVAGTYRLAPAAVPLFHQRLPLLHSAIPAAQVALLAWCSYVIGMDLPGRDALFSRLSLTFHGPGTRDGTFAYTARATAYDPRFRRVDVEAVATLGDVPTATAQLSAFVRRGIDVVPPAITASDALRGRVALVTGASRGLGAAIARSLAMRGARVYGNFRSSTVDAEALRDDLADASGSFILTQGDASDRGYCAALRASILAATERLDLLVCNATPSVRSLWFEEETSDRVSAFVASSFALAATPLATFLPMIRSGGGDVIQISSSYATEAPRELSHYVAAKCAVEGFMRAAARESEGVAFWIVRPPPLETELANLPLVAAGALSPHVVAEELVARLIEPRSPGLRVLEDFSAPG